MKTNLSWIIYMSIFLLGSCNSSNSKEPTINDSLTQPAIDSGTLITKDAQDIIVSQAKACQDTVFFYMNMAINKMSDVQTQAEQQAVKDEMNNLAKPYQVKLDSLKSLLPANRAKEIDDYRQQLFDKVTNKNKE
jgi:hypothetical protein